MKIKAVQYRKFQVTPETPQDSNSPFITVALSSEYPVQRSFGNEILLHDAANIDMTRAGKPSGLPLIVSHDDSGLPIGRLKNVRLEGKVLRADAYFSGRPEPQQYRQDVLDGMITDISVGYKILDYTVRRATSKDEPNDFLVTRWMPMEGSICAIGADPNAGFGRSLKDDEELEIEEGTEETPKEEAVEEGDRAQDPASAEVAAPQDPPLLPATETVELPPIEEMPPKPVEAVAENSEEQALEDDNRRSEAPEPAAPEASEDDPKNEPAAKPEEEVRSEDAEESEDEEDEERCAEETRSEEIKPLDELHNAELSALRSVAIKAGLKTATEIDQILQRTSDIGEARKLLLAPNQAPAIHIPTSQETRKMLTNDIFVRAMANAVLGRYDQIDEESAHFFTSKGNRSFKVDMFQTRAGEMTTTGAGAAAVYEQNIGFVELLRNRTALIKAGASVRTGTGYLSYLRQKAPTTAVLRGENTGQVTNTNVDFDRIPYVPKALVAKVFITDEYQKESIVDLMPILRADIVAQFAIAMDKYGLNGSTATATAPGISGILNTEGIYDADLATPALPTWKAVNNLKALVDQKAVNLEKCSYILDPLLMGVLETTPKFANGFGGPISEANKINGYTALTTANLAASGNNHTLVYGDMSQLEFMLMGPTEFDVNTSNLFDAGVTILTARQYFDVGVKLPGAFAACKNFLIEE